MNILIISSNRNALPVPVLPAGACMIAEAAERAGHMVDLLDLMFQRDPVRAARTAARNKTYDVIGISVRNIDNIVMGKPRFFINELAALIESIRDVTTAPVILGGAALAIMPEEILRATRADGAVIGNGEVVFPRLLERLSRKEQWNDLPGVARISGDTFRLNNRVPGPARASFAPDYERWLSMRSYRSYLATVPLQTKQGCPFQCVYCTYQTIEGASYRLSDPGDVADLALRYTDHGFRDIEFVDNVFNAPYEHALSVCESLVRTKSKTRFHCVDMSPAFLDHHLLETMERAGFAGIGLTVESASDPVLAGLRKSFTAHDVHRAAEVVKKHSVPCLWIFLFGGPGETRDTVRETLRFAKQHIRPPDAAFLNVGVRMYPGTGLETIARRQGVLTAPKSGMLEPMYYVSPEVEADWIIREVKQSMQSNLHFSDGDSFSFRYLPQITKIGRRLGLTPPLWRYTRSIRRGLRAVGMRV